jgi:hypothetical protein
MVMYVMAKIHVCPNKVLSLANEQVHLYTVRLTSAGNLVPLPTRGDEIICILYCTIANNLRRLTHVGR